MTKILVVLPDHNLKNNINLFVINLNKKFNKQYIAVISEFENNKTIKINNK